MHSVGGDDGGNRPAIEVLKHHVNRRSTIKITRSIVICKMVGQAAGGGVSNRAAVVTVAALKLKSPGAWFLTGLSGTKLAF